MLLEKQSVTSKNKQKSNFIAVINPEKLTEFNKREKKDIAKREVISDREFLVSWLFDVSLRWIAGANRIYIYSWFNSSYCQHSIYYRFGFIYTH